MIESTKSARIDYQSCPLCSCTEIPIFREVNCTRHKLYNSIIGQSIIWRRCTACLHVFTAGYFTPEAEAILFSTSQANQVTGSDLERQRFVSARMIEKILPEVNSGAWLDIGFGNGSLLFTAQEYGFEPVGIDIRQSNVDLLKQHSIEAYRINVNELDHIGRYAVISMADVLEHMPYPAECLSSVHRLLKNDGVLLVSMPNSDSSVWAALDKTNMNPYWAEIEHYHNFGKIRLYSLLQQYGFEPIRYGISERYRVCMEIVARRIS